MLKISTYATQTWASKSTGISQQLRRHWSGTRWTNSEPWYWYVQLCRVICATSCIATSDNKSINDSLPDYETACKMLNEEPKISSSWHTDGGPARKRLFFHMYHFYDILPCHQLIKTNFVGLRSGFITAETKIKKKVYFLLGSTCLPFLGGIVIKSLNRVSQARPPNRLIPRILQKRWSCKW